jgi:hypothetical protein
VAANDAVAKAMDAMAAANAALASAIAAMPQPQSITFQGAPVSVVGGAITLPATEVTVEGAKIEVQPAKAADVHMHTTVQPAAPAAVTVQGPTINNSTEVKTFPSSSKETIVRDKNNEIVERKTEHKP